MATGKTRATEGVAPTEKITASIENLLGDIRQLNGMNLAIASAAEEQSQVAQQMNDNLIMLSDSGNNSAADVRNAATEGQAIHGLTKQLESMVVRFGN